MSVINESEKKRLKSIKEKIQAYKAKEKIIQQALRNLNNAKSNKIIFDYDDEQEEKKDTKSKRIKLEEMFDNDDDDNDGNDQKEDVLWNENNFDAKKTEIKKVVLGNDARFTLDDRFKEDNCPSKETEVTTDTNECDLQKEKEIQLDILEDILGKPFVKSKDISETESTKKKLTSYAMIRYDPTEHEHYKYEIKPQIKQPEAKEKNIKKKKRDTPMPEIEESAPVEVSKDIYYTISDKLTESLKQKEEFSLLKAHGKDNNDAECIKTNDASAAKDEDKIFRFNFKADKFFKGDSSDEDEDVDEACDVDKQIEKNDKNTCNLFGYKDTLFFDKDDTRFNEAVRFFNVEAVPKDEFKNLRRELKQIVRKKIRNNEKRHQPYGKKRKIKKFSKK